MPDSKNLIDMLSLAPLERHALLDSKEGRRKAFTCYLAMREKIIMDFLPLIASSEPYINDHSKGHFERVLTNIEAILREHFPNAKSQRGIIPEGGLMTWADTVILLNALAWHDIGNIFSRKEHGQRVQACFDTISERLYDSHLGQYVVQVATAHSGDNAIENTIPDSIASTSYGSEDIHLQFLAAVLRFADEIDEDHRRAAPNEWDDLHLIPEASQRFWFFSKVNASVRVLTEAGQNSLCHRVIVESHVPASDFERQFVFQGNGNIKAITEYLRRILKFEKERRYCNAFMRKAYYHPGIDSIGVHLVTHSRSDRPANGQAISFTLSDIEDENALLATLTRVGLQDHLKDAIALGGVRV